MTVMRILRVLFLSMFLYGLWTGLYGAGLMALGMWAFVCYASGVFAAQDRAYAADPHNARALEPPTSVAAREYDCEYMRSKF